MAYDFSQDVNSSKVEEVYPPLFLDLYAELKDILHIDDAKALHKFLNGTLAASMEAAMIDLLPPMDWASEDNIQDFILDMMDHTREKFEEIYREEYTEAKGVLRNMNLEGIVYDLQVHMALVATCVAEMVIGAQDTRIDKKECVIEKAADPERPGAGASNIFQYMEDREEWKNAYDLILPWLDFPSLKQVAGFLFRNDPAELSEVITDEFDYLDIQQKRDLELLIDATLRKVSDDQRAVYGSLCGGVLSARHALNDAALGAVRKNLKEEMKIAAANIAEGVLAVQDQYIFPEDIKPGL